MTRVAARFPLTRSADNGLGWGEQLGPAAGFGGDRRWRFVDGYKLHAAAGNGLLAESPPRNV
jgi:hypothetical protein